MNQEPMTEEFVLDPKKRNLIQRVREKMRGWFSNQTSDADDEGTTEIGSVGSFVGQQEGFYSQGLFDATKENSTRIARYEDYKAMDSECTELSRALSVTVSNTFPPREGDTGTHTVKSKDNRVQKTLEEVDERVEMDDTLPQVCKSLLLYGDEFEEIVVDASFIVSRLKWLNPKYMNRKEDKFGRLDAKEAFQMKMDDASSGSAVVPFEPHQVIHTRHDYNRGDLYGRAFFFSARRPWRLLRMMEDGVVMTRLVRAVDRLAYLIPLPKGANPQQAEKILEAQMKRLKRRSIVDSSTGKFDFRKSPLTDDSDIFIGQPVDNPIADVKVLSMGGNIGQLADIEFFQNKMFMATGVPKSYLGLERDVNAKSTLSWQDIEYARLLRAIQKEMAAFQHNVYNTQLVLLGIMPTKNMYTIEYPPISFVDEELKTSIEQMKWSIAGSAKAALNIPVRWLLLHVLKLDEENVEEIMATMPPEPVAKPPIGFPEYSREQIFRDARLNRSILDLRDMIKVIKKERLAQPVQL